VAIKAYFTFGASLQTRILDNLRASADEAIMRDDFERVTKLGTAIERVTRHFHSLDSLAYEARVYEHIDAHILKRGACSAGVCANFVPFVSTTQCDITSPIMERAGVAPGSVRRQFLDALGALHDRAALKVGGGTATPTPTTTTNKIHADRVSFSVTKRVVKSELLHKVLAREPLSEDRVRAYTFQVLAALGIMLAHDIQHNDLHFANILVDLAPATGALVYAEGGRSYRVPTRPHGRILLFDWDFARCGSCGVNHRLDDALCAESGVCPAANRKFDLYMVMRQMYLTVREVAVNSSAELRDSRATYLMLRGETDRLVAEHAVNPAASEQTDEEMRVMREEIRDMGQALTGRIHEEMCRHVPQFVAFYRQVVSRDLHEVRLTRMCRSAASASTTSQNGSSCLPFPTANGPTSILSVEDALQKTAYFESYLLNR
jgi:hypothetical protein